MAEQTHIDNLLKITISACMIVKNEEHLLTNCLNSIKSVVDEIIIVDTGSTDDTIKIAKSFGAKVFLHPWNDSFSEARNHSLNYASGDWILQIDADEELEQADIPILKSAINCNGYNGIIVSIQSVIKDNLHTFYTTRIFRRNKGFYKDIIHEQLIVEGNRLSTEIRLYHHGYNLDKEKMEVKWQRTTYLLKKQIEQNKFDSFAWFNLVRNYRTQDLFQDGINAGMQALAIISPNLCSKHTETNVNLHHYAMISYETANCYLHNEDFTNAKELCHTALSKLAQLEITPDNIDIIFTLACIYLKEGRYGKAIDYFNKFLYLRKSYLDDMNANSLMIDTLGYDYAAYNGMGYCFGNLGQWEQALLHLKKAILCNPRYLNAYKNLTSCYTNLCRYTEAINTLLRTVSEGIADDAVLLKLGELYIQQEAFEKAIPYLEEYLKIHPDDGGAVIKLAQSYEKLGHLEAALIGYRSVMGK
ncbi:MAG: glycosyltransferase [Candidatus Brocadia sp.]|nr:glycosyltransferase [Candidatus Brocadia sp.]